MTLSLQATAEAAIALCRMDNKGRCACERIGRGVFCARYLREVSEIEKPYLASMRDAMRITPLAEE